MISYWGLELQGRKKLICKLQKSLYGLKQSPRQRYKRFDKFIIGCAYTRSLYEPCVYFLQLPSGEYIYLLLYVDDVLIVSTNRSSIDNLKIRLSSGFKMNCNALIPRVRRRYCDVYTQVRNTLTYIRKASVHSRIRVQKHSDNIHSSNNNTSTQLSQSVIQYLKNIRSPRIAKAGCTI